MFGSVDGKEVRVTWDWLQPERTQDSVSQRWSWIFRLEDEVEVREMAVVPESGRVRLEDYVEVREMAVVPESGRVTLEDEVEVREMAVVPEYGRVR
ncbi:hypothetical protein DPMN_032207 [Dreissena polymorpha]|uniref:Cytochrome oxidase subunit II copper A binding domain-containing protein n=1 Tax=Dreissena polymorpha TaxID=45954 RepID=A0A9D4M3B6_DREPO|nr:hypothetical protein DPMN_032207 [Dreissena polymorpha]